MRPRKVLRENMIPSPAVPRRLTVQEPAAEVAVPGAVRTGADEQGRGRESCCGDEEYTRRRDREQQCRREASGSRLLRS